MSLESWWSLPKYLRALMRASTLAPPAAARRSELEARLVDRLQHRYGPAAPALPGPTWLRKALVAGATMIAGIVLACQVPVAYELEMGLRLVLSLPESRDNEARIDALNRALEASAHAQRIEIRAIAEGQGRMLLSLQLWGEDVDEAVVRNEVDRLFPGAKAQAEALSGKLRTSLGDRLAHQWFARALDEADVEAARRAILEQLQARGFRGHAKVEIDEPEEGHRRVRIEVRQRGEGSPEDGDGRHVLPDATK